MARILVVDDDLDTRAALCRFLSVGAFEVFEAKDGISALALARARQPNVILLDIFMPGKDGIEVLRELAPEMPETGFIMITGNEDEALARQCLECGAFDYVSKPINLAALAKAIQVLLSFRKK